MMVFQRRAGVFSVLAVSCLLTLLSVGTCWAGLQVIGIDVGQGDCTLIISPTGKTVLIDAGYTGKGTGTVLPYLQSRGIESLDYTVASHYHVDHIGGLDEVVNAIGRDSLKVAAYDRGYNYNTLAYTQYVTAVGTKRQTMTEYQVIDLGGGATLTCLGLNSMGRLSPPYDNARYDDNNLSIAVLLEYGEFQMLLGGDLPGQNSSSYYDIESILAPRAGDVDVYKVNHHGSATSSQTTLLNATLPEACLVYVGNGNSYGHPTQAVINRLVAVNCYIYQTELGSGGTIPVGKGEVANGNVVIDVDGGQYTINGREYSLASAGVAGELQPMLLAITPNPFSNQAKISFRLSADGPGAIKIFDVAGRLVNSYPVASGAAGINTFTWNGRSSAQHEVPAGIYFVRVSSEGGSGSEAVTAKIVKR